MHLTDKSILGEYHWKGKRNLINIVFLGIPKELPGKDNRHGLHRLLGALFSVGLNGEERIDILENEYGIDVRSEFGEELKEMCNLGQGIWEQGIEQGIEMGIERGISQGELKKAKETAGKLYSDGWDVGNIAELLNYRPELVCEWLGCGITG